MTLERVAARRTARATVSVTRPAPVPPRHPDGGLDLAAAAGEAADGAAASREVRPCA